MNDELNNSELLETIGTNSFNAKVYLNDKQFDENKKIIVVVNDRNHECERKYYKMDKNFLETQKHVEEITTYNGYAFTVTVKVKYFGLPIIQRGTDYKYTISIPD